MAGLRQEFSCPGSHRSICAVELIVARSPGSYNSWSTGWWRNVLFIVQGCGSRGSPVCTNMHAAVSDHISAICHNLGYPRWWPSLHPVSLAGRQTDGSDLYVMELGKLYISRIVHL